jgi:hypothetical protein
MRFLESVGSFSIEFRGGDALCNEI